jgi:hypothetical protein
MRIAPILLAGLVALAPRMAVAASSYAFVTTTDFGGPGCASWVGLDPPWTAHNCVEPTSSDPAARWALGRVYVVNRFGADNIQVLDPANDFATLLQFSVGNGTNPQDIAVVSASKAYVTLLNADYLLVVNPATGAPLDSIPLVDFADADGIPEATKLIVYGERLFVALQRLFAFAPTAYSSVAVVDLTTDTVVDADPVEPGAQAIRLSGRNPVSDFAVDPSSGRLLIATAAAYGVNDDGGVEGIDPAALTTTGFETTEALLGGEVNDIAVGAGGERFAVRSGFNFDDPSAVVGYATDTGLVAQTVYATAGFSLGDIETNDRGELWVCDRTFASPGLRVFAVSDGAAIAGPIDVGLPPFDIVFDDAVVVDVSPSASAPSLRFLAIGPNPSRGEVEIHFSVAVDGSTPVRLRVFDARGALVGGRESSVTPGAHRWRWRAPGGASAGTYFFRIESETESAEGRFVLVP